jgi:hypothetical protein
VAIDSAQKRAAIGKMPWELGLTNPSTTGTHKTDDRLASMGAIAAYGWTSASSLADGVSDNWTDAANGHDGDTATYTVEKSASEQTYWEAIFTPAIRAEKFRFIGHQYFDPVEDNPDFETWLYYDGQWNQQYTSGGVAKDEWCYFDVFGDWHTARLVSRVRIRSENTSFFLRVHEFQLLSIGNFVTAAARPLVNAGGVGANPLCNCGLIGYSGFQYLGDFQSNQTVNFKWAGSDVTGYSANLIVNGVVSVYKNDSATQSTAGVTTVEPFDQLNGLFHTKIVTTDDFYEDGCDYTVVVANCNVDSRDISTPIASFSIGNRTGTGHGDIEYTYTVREGNEDTGPVLAGVDVWISTDAAGSLVIWRGFTDANGVARDGKTSRLPKLDVGTCFFWCEKSGYTFNNPDSQVVS